MNIKAQCCGVVLLLVLMVFYVRQKRIKLHTEKAFLRIWVVSLCSLALDILSVVCITYQEVMPAFLVNGISKLYVTSLLWTAVCSLLYVFQDVYRKKESLKQKTLVLVAVGIVNSLMILALPIEIVKEAENVVYTKGPSVWVTYFFVFCMSLSLALVVEFNRNNINPRRKEAIRIWIGILVAAGGIQFVDNRLLFVGFAGAIGVMVIFLLLENPQLNIDQQTGLFNQAGFLQYIEQLNDRKERFAMVSMTMPQSNSIGVRKDTLELMQQEIYDFLLRIPGAMVFRYSDEEIFLIFEKCNLAEEGVSLLKDYFRVPIDSVKSNMIQPHFLYISAMEKVKCEEDISYLLRYIKETHPIYDEDHFIYVDEATIDAMYEEKEVEKLIIYAIEQDKVEVFFQPIYSNKERAFVSAEALARIRDKDGKLIPPGVFIGVAEKNGLILRLGEKVFENVCRFIKEKHPEKYGLQYIEVNLSVIQCSCHYLAKSFVEIMHQYGVNPKFINLEITESATFESKKNLLDNMITLRDHGVRFSLDDFGSGQSNLNYIVDMPVDIVKFDRDMTTAYFQNGKAKHVMNAAIEMIHGMDLEIVSEGVETKEQFQRMEQLGIRFIQGYYFSRPLPPEDFLRFMEQNCVAS